MALDLPLSLNSVSPFAPQKQRYFRGAKDETGIKMMTPKPLSQRGRLS